MKISEFFENSAMDDRLIKFDTISNEIDIVRLNLYSVKELSKFFELNFLLVDEFNLKLNPPKASPSKTGKKTAIGKGSKLLYFL